MKLESNRLMLKEVGWDDSATIHRLYSLPEIDEYNTLGIPQNIDATREIIRPMIEAGEIEPRKLYLWKILKKDSNEFIDLLSIALSPDRFRLGEVSYELFPTQWGQGYATEAVRTVVKLGFEELHLHKIEAGVATENIRSIKVLEKAGMTREGLRRKILPIRGEWKDSYHYAIVEDDPRDY